MRLERHVPSAWSKLSIIPATLVLLYKIRYGFVAKISEGLLNRAPLSNGIAALSCSLVQRMHPQDYVSASI